VEIVSTHLIYFVYVQKPTTKPVEGTAKLLERRCEGRRAGRRGVAERETRKTNDEMRSWRYRDAVGLAHRVGVWKARRNIWLDNAPNQPVLAMFGHTELVRSAGATRAHKGRPLPAHVGRSFVYLFLYTP